MNLYQLKMPWNNWKILARCRNEDFGCSANEFSLLWDGKKSNETPFVTISETFPSATDEGYCYLPISLSTFEDEEGQTSDYHYRFAGSGLKYFLKYFDTVVALITDNSSTNK